MACTEHVIVPRMAPGMLAEPFTMAQGCALTLVRLAEQAAGASALRAFAFVVHGETSHRAINTVESRRRVGHSRSEKRDKVDTLLSYISNLLDTFYRSAPAASIFAFHAPNIGD